MRNLRGLVALMVSVALGLLAAYAVWQYMKRPAPAPRPASVAVVPKKEPTPATFTGAIPEGKRAFSIRVDEVTGVSRKLRKGDMVDVIATTDLQGNDDARVSRVILQNIELLDVTLETGAETTKGRRSSSREEQSWTVSFLVTPEEAAALAVAESAHIRLMARNQADDNKEKPVAVGFSNNAGPGKVQRLDRDLPDLIPAGMRAITLEIQQTDGILGVLRPHDRVDVIVTCPFSQFSSGGNDSPGAQGQVTEYRQVSRTMVQDVEILLVETELKADVDKKVPVSLVTLVVSPDQAETLAVLSDASSKSLVRLVSRNNRDRSLARTRGQYLSDLLTQKHVFHQVQEISGKKATLRKFYE